MICYHCGRNGFVLTMSCRTHLCWQAVLDYRKREYPWGTPHRDLLRVQRGDDHVAQVLA